MEPPRIETEITLNVPPGYREGARLDVYITNHVLNATRSKVQLGIRAGRVRVNDKIVTRVSHSVAAGDRIVCLVMKPPPMRVEPEDIPLDIVFEDDLLIVVNKPAGMVVHPAFGNRRGTLVNALLHHVGAPSMDADDDALPDETGLSTSNAFPSNPEDPSVRPGIIHRLDKDTSGLMVVAKDDVTHAKIARQFADRTIRRRYDAIVWGKPDPPAGRVEAPIGRSPRDRKKMAVVSADAGKRAATRYETVRGMTYTVHIHATLETGRTHQIRVHMAHLGHPVFGDTTYGGDRIRFGPDTRNRRQFMQNLFDVLPRQALHASTLGFVHPASGEEMLFELALPDDFQEVLDRLVRQEGGPDT